METFAAPALRLAVLPASDELADSKEKAYFSRGFIEDLITDLSRFPNLGLISHHSSFSPRIQNLDDRSIAQELAADLLLKTSVRNEDHQIRVNTQLIDPKSGSVVWADRFDSPAADVFSLQESISEKVTSTLSKQIDAATLGAARRKSITELEAYDCWLRGLEKLREGNIESDEEARELFERALEIDPHYPRAFVGLSLSHFNEWSCQNWELSEISECRAFQYAHHAFQLDQNDSVAHLVLGRVYLFRREFEKAEEHITRAFELNPNDADHLVQIASCFTFLGSHERAEQIFDRALALNPYCDPWYFAYGGVILMMQKKFDEGIAMALKAPLTNVWIDLAAFVAIAHAYQNDPQKAATYRDLFLEAFQEKIVSGRRAHTGEPRDWLIEVNPFKRKEDANLYINGLRLAGFEEKPAASPTPSPIKVAQNDHPVFRLENNLRIVAYEGAKTRLPEIKGFKDIERILANKDAEIHCTELMGNVSEDGAPDEIMDAKARSEYARNIRELQADLEDAKAANDSARAESIREELDPLIDHLAKSVGVGGRSRKMAAPAERARSAVTWRIRSAIRKIEAAHPALGRHLENSIRTGTFCAYSPEKPVHWTV
ncbi:MAG: tetratricopeptide repeat protein [Verrucomicrobiota bacterium]